MKFYGDDFFSAEDVSSWKDSTQLLYLKILWRQWAHLGLAEDPRVISANVGTPWHKFKTAWATFAHKFPLDSDNRRRNQKLHAVFLGEEKAFEGRKKGADTVNAKRKSADAERTLSDTVSARSACGNGEVEGELQQQQHAGAIAPCTPQQQRLWVLLRLWDAHRTTAMQPAPSPTEALMKSLAKIDRPSRDWESIIRDVTSWPALNGTAPPKPGYPSPYVLTFGKLLTAKIADAAERGEYRNQNKLRSPDMTDGNAEVLRRSVELAIEQKARTQ